MAEDKRAGGRIYALICDPTLPVRVNMMRSLRGVKASGILPMIEFGPVPWPDGRSCMAVLYQEPLGGRVRSDTRTRNDPIHERDINRMAIDPLRAGIKELNERRVTHRAIRPDNLYYMDPARQQIVFGDCVTSPPGYDQPMISETIVSGMTQRDGRGAGMLENDLYAFGVVILSLLTGRHPCADLSDEDILHAKITQGSYQALIGDLRLPLPMTELLRGLVSDDPQQRWDLEALDLWTEGRRLSPIQTKPAQKAQRDFPFKGKLYSNTRELAAALGQNWDAAVDPIRDGQLETWLKRSLDDKGRGEAITKALKLVAASSMDSRAITDSMVTTVMSVLDPMAPIR
ncbi:MAG: serine/threonine protein kinase [Alphaproteobacteria bacterium]|nr:serine/threonine protein kinase [Alphaproteobacteria bacterium]